MTAEDKRELFQAIGMAVVAFSGLEDNLRDAIYLASGADSPAVTVLTAGLRYRTLVGKFAAVCRECARPYTMNTTPEALKAFCKFLNSLNVERDALVHSVWAMDESEHPAQRAKWSVEAEEGVKLRVAAVTVAEVRDLVRRIKQAEDKLWEIAVHMRTPRQDADSDT